jgi:transposase
MNAYSLDLREKIVAAKERGMSTAEAARAFGVGLSSVKRYAKTAREGGSLRPKRSPGRHPKADERAKRLLEADLEDRPAATLAQRREYRGWVIPFEDLHQVTLRIRSPVLPPPPRSKEGAEFLGLEFHN